MMIFNAALVADLRLPSLLLVPRRKKKIKNIDGAGEKKEAFFLIFFFRRGTNNKDGKLQEGRAISAVGSFSSINKLTNHEEYKSTIPQTGQPNSLFLP